MAGITVKPTIANREFTYDASAIDQADGTDVLQWDDQSGNSNHATGVGSVGKPVLETTGFNSLPCVRLEADNRHFTYDGSPFVAANLTWFMVIEATDISSHLAVIGSSSSSTPPRRSEVFIKSDGTIIAGFQNDPYDLESSAGEISTGDKLVITFRHSGTTGKVLRVNGVEKDANAGSTSPLIDYTNATLGRVKDDTTGGVGTIYGADRRFAWLEGYSTAATDALIADMECYLGTRFKISVDTCPPPDVIRANLQIETTVTIELELPQTVEMRLQLEQTITEDVDA